MELLGIRLIPSEAQAAAAEVLVLLSLLGCVQLRWVLMVEAPFEFLLPSTEFTA
jgi:hypothetical protein